MRRRWILAVAVTLAAGCGGTTHHRLSGVGAGAGADAQVALEPTGAGDRRLQLRVRGLPPPQELDERYRAYHVWVAPLGETPVKVGRLAYDEEAQTGHLNAVTPHHGFRLIVTPEATRLTRRSRESVVFDQYVGT